MAVSCVCVTLFARSPAAVCWIKLIRTCNKCSCFGALCPVRSTSGVALMPLTSLPSHTVPHQDVQARRHAAETQRWQGKQRRLEVSMQQLWSECMATVMLAGSRPYGRPEGLVQAFPPSHFSSLLLRGFTDAWTRCSTNLSGSHAVDSVSMSAALRRNCSVSKKFGFHLTYLWPWHEGNGICVC